MIPLPLVSTRRLQSVKNLDDVERIMREIAAGEGATRADYLGELVADHLDAGGKRVRARLALAAAATWPRLSKVRGCIMCVQPSVASSQ